VAEEILFRGMLFDALLARTSIKRTVWISGVVFGLVHLIDPAALPLVPALIGLGVILGYARQRTDSLSQPILMHIGFNSVTAIGLFIAV
jgi:membrane protease YdiL (CAAX protease family)